MPATASRIGFITQAVRNAIAGPDEAVALKYGDLARDTKEPLECFFDSEADAALVAQERLALLSPDRRRFLSEVSGADVGRGLQFNVSTPTARIIDTEKAADLPAATVEIGIDYEAGKTILSNWG
ncbi:hypothetical protein SAMIE_1015680 [Sphingobium amiense]|uniref:Uncharacterized protein n=1 Tax=Sphingobium amiense TaxID=135719 RepID=A0A494W686_9SPHN|nr:hypothetical protein [Sphingobium amiense]BBD98067.1 hypothetical protein SAMIE_1015680 [Sphingobium amiense]